MFETVDVVLKDSKNPSFFGFLTKKGKDVYKDLRISLIEFTDLKHIDLSIPQHLYFTNNENIKVGDLCHDKILNILFEIDETTDLQYVNQTDNVQKIVATTDTKLIEESRLMRECYPLQIHLIPQYFVEYFVEQFQLGNIVTKTKIEYILRSNAGLGHNQYVYLQHIKNKKYVVIDNERQNEYQLGSEEEFEDYEIEKIVKVDTNNFVNVSIENTNTKGSPEKTKVINLLKKFKNDFSLYRGIQIMDSDIEKWVNKNL